LQSQLNAFIAVDPAGFNKQHLKVLELQPAGRFIAPSFSFPSTKTHFELLKSLGPDRQFTSLTTKYDHNSKPHKLIGVEISFKNGQKIQLGA